MEQLEKKILEKVYRFETKRTFIEIVLRLLSILTAIILLLTMFNSLIVQLLQQKTFDVFQLFKEDSETILTNIKDILETLYYEVPKEQILTIILFVIILFVLILLLLNNSQRIKNNIKSLSIYWKIKV
jgi:uncharacterized BrkB/YihY/UPF0761 family membrane protein